MSHDEHSAETKKGETVECGHCEGKGESQKDCCLHSSKKMPWDTAPCCVCKGEKVVHI